MINSSSEQQQQQQEAVKQQNLCHTRAAVAVIRALLSAYHYVCKYKDRFLVYIIIETILILEDR